MKHRYASVKSRVSIYRRSNPTNRSLHSIFFKENDSFFYEKFQAFCIKYLIFLFLDQSQGNGGLSDTMTKKL